MGRTKAHRKARWSDWPRAFEAPALCRHGCIMDCFDAARPLVLDIGCGKGEATLALARRSPHLNVLGLDFKAARLFSGARAASGLALGNAAFVRGGAEILPVLLHGQRAIEAWILFPDPQARPGKAEKRLVSPRYLSLYHRVMAPEGLIHLKTDDVRLLSYLLRTLRTVRWPVHRETEDRHGGALPAASDHPVTAWERRFRAAGKAIHYVCFGVGPDPAPFVRRPLRSGIPPRQGAARADLAPDR